MATVLEKRKQARIAGFGLLKVRDIYDKCGITDNIIKVDNEEYQALAEIEKAIRMLHGDNSISWEVKHDKQSSISR